MGLFWNDLTGHLLMIVGSPAFQIPKSLTSQKPILIIIPSLLLSPNPKEHVLKDLLVWEHFGLSILILKTSFIIVGVTKPFAMPFLTFGVKQLNGTTLPLVKF